MLWIMDASINISMEPFRAFVGDMLPDRQRTLGFTMQSFFIGIGAFVASWLPYILSEWFNISNTAPAGKIPDTVKYSFYLGGIVFFIAVLYTVLSTKEYSPEELEDFDRSDHPDRPPETFSVEPAGKYLKRGIIWTAVGALLTLPIIFFRLEKELYILAGGLITFGLLQMLSNLLVTHGRERSGLVSIITDLYRMPKTMGQLAIVQFFSWFALFSLWIYTTAAVTSTIYGTSDTTSELYNEGANLVSGMFGWYNLFAAVFGLLLLPFLARVFNRKITHSISLVAGGLGLLSFFIISNPQHLIFSMIGIGLAWASILAMPYAILTGSLPTSKMGVYMGIFNFFIVIPQILAATILGFMVSTLFGGQSIYALLSGGCSLFVAAVLILFVEDTKGKVKEG
jgi:maltose/moltooligosaccharide transporter